jgi:hypothetical protein
MAFSRRRTALAAPEPEGHPSSLVASAARIRNVDGQGWRTYKFGDDSWQQEAWRLYDIIGELRFTANWVGSACSRVRIYVADVDDNGRVQQETKKKKVAGLADSLFGSPPAKAEALRMLGINLFIAGESYIVGKGAETAASDEWYVVSCSELKRWNGTVNVLNPDGTKDPLDLDKDIVIRVWTPHPRRSLWADSPTRAAMPMLWEIERLTRYVFAQIDSRLVSAGMLPIPKEVSFPDMDPEVPGAEGLAQLMMRAGSMSLKGEGTAAGVFPTVVEMPMEALGKIELIQFASELSKQALDLRAEAIRRFALAVDVAPEILTGTGDSNHWSAWHVEESNVKVHIEPVITRICDALTRAYLVPALKAIKEDASKYVFWYDTAPLTVRPQRLTDTLNLYKEGVVGASAVLLAGDYKITDAMTPEEDIKLFVRQLMERDPNLFQIHAVRKAAGITDEVLPPSEVTAPPQPGMPGVGPPPPPAPPTGIVPTGPEPLPVNSTAQNALGGPGENQSSNPSAGLTASTYQEYVPPSVRNLNTFVISNATVLRAMEVAGKRLLGREKRERWPGVPAHELHTMIKVGGEDRARELLAGAWDHLAMLAEGVDPTLDTGSLKQSLDHYCVQLLVSEQSHHHNKLGEFLRDRGFLHGGS